MAVAIANAGRANEYLLVDEFTVTRAYDAGWLHGEMTQEAWKNEFLDYHALLSKFKLTIAGEWTYEFKALGEDPRAPLTDVVVIGNPRAQLLSYPEVEREFAPAVIFEAYEHLLRRLIALWLNHRVIISDAHSHNMCPCRVEGQLVMLILDGKLGGPTRDVGMGLYRLDIKWRGEEERNQRWLLDRYCRAIRARSRSRSRSR
jgi:hypothetical protein